MKNLLILSLIILIVILSGCSSNYNLDASSTSNNCVDKCVELRCNMFDETGRSDGFSCAGDYKVKENFIQSCKEDCGLVKKTVGCQDYSPTLTLTSINRTEDEILNARKNYNIQLINYNSEGRGYCYNTNTQKKTSSNWLMLKLNITNNNDFSLNVLTIKISQFNGQSNIGWGRLVIPTNDIKPKETKEAVVYYPGDLSSISTVTNVEVSIEDNLDLSSKQFIKELN